MPSKPSDNDTGAAIVAFAVRAGMPISEAIKLAEEIINKLRRQSNA